MTYDLTIDSGTKRVTGTPAKSEIEKLEDMIREQHPDWNIEVSELHGGTKIDLLDRKGKYICDAVCHKYSYGGDEGLLEWWNKRKAVDVIGYLTAEKALRLFEKEAGV